MEKFNELEQKLNANIDLLEVTRSYCESNYDKSNELSILHSVLEVIINNEKEAKKTLDYIVVG